MKLKQGEVICSKCNGSGNQAKWDQIPDYKCYLECDKCHGSGKLDWIENIVGKKPPTIKDYQIDFRMFYSSCLTKNSIICATTA